MAETEIKLLRTALNELADSTNPDDEDVANLLSIALKIRDGQDIIYALKEQEGSDHSKIQTPKYYPELSLEDELERQRVEITNRVAVPLGMDRNVCLSSLPTRFPDRPAVYNKLHLTTPLIVPQFESLGFSWLQVVEGLNFYVYSGLKDAANNGQLNLWKDQRRGAKPFPKAPYTVWVQDGSRYVNRKPVDVRKELEREERAGNHWQGLALAMLRPDMLQNKYWDLIGGSVGSGSVPSVYWGGQPEFGCDWVDGADPGFRSLVCGSEFIVA